METKPVNESAARLPRTMMVLVTLAAGWFVLQAMTSMKSLVGPIFLAMTLVIAVYPMIGFLRRRNVPGWLAATAAAGAVYTILFFFGWSIVYAVDALVAEVPNYRGRFDAFKSELEEFTGPLGNEEVTKFITEQSSKLDYSKVASTVTNLAGQLASAGSAFALIVFISAFLVFDSLSIPRRMQILAQTRPGLAAGCARFARGVRSYWVVTTVFGAIVAVFDYFALVIIGVPLAMTWAIFSFVTNYIPNVGFVIGLIPPALLALIDQGFAAMMWVIVAYIVLNTVIQTFIQPKFTGDAVGITATMSFVSLVFWSAVIGPLGALLAIPMTLLCKTFLVDIDPDARWANALIAADPAQHPLEADDPSDVLPSDLAEGDDLDASDGASRSAADGVSSDAGGTDTGGTDTGAADTATADSAGSDGPDSDAGSAGR